MDRFYEDVDSLFVSACDAFYVNRALVAGDRSTGHFRSSQPHYRKCAIRRQPVINEIGGRQASPRNNPRQQSMAFQTSRVCDHSNLVRQAARHCRHLVVRVAENIGVIEIPLPNEALGIDGQPATRTEAEDIAMVHISMQHYDVLLSSQQVVRCGSCDGKKSTPRLGGRFAINRRPAIVIKPPLKGNGWLAAVGCCKPNIHRDLRVAIDGRRIETGETFAVDWNRVKNDKIYDEDGKTSMTFPSDKTQIRNWA